MNTVRLKTSEETERKIDEMNSSLRLSTKAAVARIAIGVSLKKQEEPSYKFRSVDSNGFEFQRFTLTGDYDDLYKAMIIEKHGKPLMDSEYFPKYVKMHIEHGVSLLYSEFRMAGNREKLISKLLSDNI